MNGDAIKLAAVVIISAVLVVLLRAKAQEYSFLLVVAIVCIAVIFVLADILPQIKNLQSAFQKSGSNVMYFSVALKALGITYITDFAANVCRDFGLLSLANTAELAGKAGIFVLSIPLVCAVLEVALKFIGL